MAYPSYSKFFGEIDGKCAMYFWKTYPSPLHLQEKAVEELTMEFKEISPIIRKDKAGLILDCIHNDGDTFRECQESRDFITISLVRDLEHQKEELVGLDKEIEKILLSFDYKLTSMPGIGTSIASKLIAEIGDIRRFSNADKLARFAGVAPVKFSSAGKGKEQSSRQGNRQLHGLFYFLAVTMVPSQRTEYPIIRYSMTIICGKSVKERQSRRQGYKVEMLDEVPGGNGYGIKPNSNPDFLIEDKVFDCYAPKVDTNTKGIVKEIYNKTKKQTPNIVVNLDDYAGNIPELTDS